MFVLYSHRSGFYSPPSTTGRTTPIGSTSVKPHTAFFQPKEMVPNICYCVWLKVTAENNPPLPQLLISEICTASTSSFYFFFLCSSDTRRHETSLCLLLLFSSWRHRAKSLYSIRTIFTSTEARKDFSLWSASLDSDWRYNYQHQYKSQHHHHTLIKLLN